MVLGPAIVTVGGAVETLADTVVVGTSLLGSKALINRDERSATWVSWDEVGVSTLGGALVTVTSASDVGTPVDSPPSAVAPPVSTGGACPDWAVAPSCC